MEIVQTLCVWRCPHSRPGRQRPGQTRNQHSKLKLPGKNRVSNRQYLEQTSTNIPINANTTTIWITCWMFDILSSSLAPAAQVRLEATQLQSCPAPPCTRHSTCNVLLFGIFSSVIEKYIFPTPLNQQHFKIDMINVLAAVGRLRMLVKAQHIVVRLPKPLLVLEVG